MLFFLLSTLALVPWAIAIAESLHHVIGSAPTLGEETEIVAGSQAVNWKVIWHLSVLILFLVLLIRKYKGNYKDKLRWLYGLLFLWPFVSPPLAWKLTIGRTKMANGEKSHK